MVFVSVLSAVSLIVILALVVLDRQNQRRHRERMPSPVQDHPCKIQHQTVPIAAQPIPNAQLATTILLMRCQGCGIHVTAHDSGQWDIADFLKRESDVAGEIRRLEGMVR